jgi:hypothetical protein
MNRQKSSWRQNMISLSLDYWIRILKYVPFAFRRKCTNYLPQVHQNLGILRNKLFAKFLALEAYV